MIYIYALQCPVAKCVRYIGKANDPETRFTQHLSGAVKGSTHCANWIRKLRAQGLAPTIKIILRVDGNDDWQKAEIECIAKYRAAGHRLTNITSGGEGFKGLPPASMEKLRASLRKAWANPISKAKRIAKMSAIAKECANRPEVRLKNSESQKFAWTRLKATNGFVEKRNDKISKTMLDLWSDPEVKAKRLATLHSDEVKAKRYALRDTPEKTAIRAAKLKAAWANPEARAQRLAVMQSPEVKAKAAQKAKIKWADPEYKKRHSAAVKAAYQKPEVKANLAAAMTEVRRRKLAAQPQPEPA